MNSLILNMYSCLKLTNQWIIEYHLFLIKFRTKDNYFIFFNLIILLNS